MANEVRLIDATRLEYWIDGVIHGAEVNGNAPTVNLYDVLTYLDGMPTVDAVEVVHGRWIVDAVEVDHPFLEFESVWRDVHQCSICKEYFDVSDARNYCPNCGAKMDGGTPQCSM